jgi:hypothetical protein
MDDTTKICKICKWCKINKPTNEFSRLFPEYTEKDKFTRSIRRSNVCTNCMLGNDIINSMFPFG